MIPDFGALSRALNLEERAFQTALSSMVSDALKPGTPVTVAVQAGTGIGKTWAVTHPALAAAAAGRRVVWSTHTIFQREQVIETMRKARGALPDIPAVAERRGRSDYVSPSRTNRLRHALEARGEAKETLGLLDDLARAGGLLAAFTRERGDLPVAPRLVCLTAACPDEEQADYEAQKHVAEGAGIVVQTHALTLLQARFGRLTADLIIFDEADTLPSVAAGAVETRLPLDDIAVLAEQVNAGTAPLIDALRARANDRIVWCDQPMSKLVIGLAQQLSAQARASRDTAPELAEALDDMAEELRDFGRRGLPPTERDGDVEDQHSRRVGAALIEDAGPTLAVAAVDAAGWLGHRLKDRQVVLMSATLGRHDEELDEVRRACRRLGFFDVASTTISPLQFGTVRFHLAARDIPPPFKNDREPDPRFFDVAADMVRQAARNGRTLVLCASFADVEELAQRLDKGVIFHRRGERLSPLTARLEAEPGAVLVTPGAWAGLDLKDGIENVVIVRLPLGRPDALRQELLSRLLERRGMSAVDARNILAAEARGDAMRRMTQGMGRGVRQPDHHCDVWIADPRFPLPAGMVADVRRGITQGAATGWEEFAKSIPLRFRRPSGRSAYDRAKVFQPAAIVAT
ncbi:helicase C-terminal domain-containing protein [Roseomonas sp. CAU 1739]|uniref:helicase C-terminal domain-containing protein n=1 Tax=Roseomonas sp. CAU 1739 TaxID=3140364 RepID=UPI00325BD551